ncbi:MAG TPA: outer membrane lipoprotein carrier protein LolA [Alphaproteobacteria bacterium]|nr:outer membrane lipoprotein carrier protein LolA [Alphaproteobacteria bacterium]
MKNILCLSIALAAFSLPALAEDIMPTGPQVAVAPLAAERPDGPASAPAVSNGRSEQDQQTIARVQDYLNNIRTLKAEFMQTLSNGSTTNGTLFIKRPGKMRLQYAPPNRDLLVADGTFVHAWDSQAHTSSSVPLGRSLADIILRDPLKLSGDIRVKEVRYYPQMLEIDITQANDPASGTLTLELQDNPLQLKNWRVKDGQGVMTRVSLYNEQVNQDIPGSTFAYKDPSFGHLH